MINRKSINLNKNLDARWGALMTFVWATLLLLLTQVVVAYLVMAYHLKKLGLSFSLENTQRIDLLADATMQAVVYGSLLMVLSLPCIIFLKKDSSLIAYLPFSRISIIDMLKWLALSFAVMLLSSVLFQAVSAEESAEMGELINHVESLPWMYVAIVLAAPISEELLFRGFMISGLERINLPDASAVAVFVSSFIWGIIHMQYNHNEVFQIFLLGLVFGYARIKTRSLLTPILLHIINNLIAVFFVTGS